MYEREREWLAIAQELARQAGDSGDVPVAALVYDELGRELGRGVNTRVCDNDPTGHAEINALRAAGRARGSWNLSGCTLVVSLEPCTMCAGAIVNARISRLVFAAWDDKAGAAGSVRDVVRDSRLNHQVEVIGGVSCQRASEELRQWFIQRRGE
ncbi:nucleoside deaminase [Trueperella sp. LYQ143]|uniref:nucleoside deaminase n=1 Tax=unclassified Trueperella TaxID=2630174 RepID=UPI0039835C9B